MARSMTWPRTSFGHGPKHVHLNSPRWALPFLIDWKLAKNSNTHQLTAAMPMEPDNSEVMAECSANEASPMPCKPVRRPQDSEQYREQDVKRPTCVRLGFLLDPESPDAYRTWRHEQQVMTTAPQSFTNTRDACLNSESGFAITSQKKGSETMRKHAFPI